MLIDHRHTLYRLLSSMHCVEGVKKGINIFSVIKPFIVGIGKYL